MVGADVSLRALRSSRGRPVRARCRRLLQPRVLPLELLEPPRLVDAEAAVLAAPPVVGLLSDAELPAHLACRLAAGQLDFGLTQLRDDLLGAVPLPPHRAPPSPPRVSIIHAGAV